MRETLALALILIAQTCKAGIQVEISGLPSEIEQNARAYLSLVTFGQRGHLPEPGVRRLYAKAGGEIREALQPYGYFDSRISPSLDRTGDNWIAKFEVQLGPAVIVDIFSVSINGEGRSDPAFRDIVETPLLKAGDVLVQSFYEKTKERLQQAASEKGYLDAQFTENELTVDTQNSKASATIVFDTGSQYRFGKININQTILNDRIVRAYVNIREGEDFATHKLLGAQYALYDSEYFSWAEVLPKDKDPNQHTVNVEVSAAARKRQHYAFGIGYSSDTRYRGLASWKSRRINRRGHKGEIKLTIASTEENLTGQYIIPGRNPLVDRSNFVFSRIHEKRAETVSRRLELGFNKYRQRGKWQRKLSLLLNQEDSELPGLDQEATLLTPSISFLMTEQDDVLFPRKGKKFFTELATSYEALGSDTDFWQLRMRASLIYPIADKYRLLVRADIGVSIVDEFSELHASRRFFAGGDHSVRGFSRDELSDTDQSGNRIGGEFLKLISIEADRRIFDKWAVAAFVDGGGALEEFGDEIQYSFGVGLRWQSPVGMLRLDVAKPISVGDRNPRIHFTIGPDL